MKRLINLLIFQILTFVSFSQTRTTSGDAIRKEIAPKFVNGVIKQFTIAQLKTQSISNGDSTTLYYVTDAGKKGYFELDKNDNSSTGNDSTIIVTNNGKRLKRTIEQYLSPSTTGKYYRGDKTWQVITKSDIPTLSNVDNTSDLNKPISTATQTALLGKLDKGYSISELRGLSNSVLAATQMFYCSEAGKEGFWKYDASDNSSTDNLGTILVTGGGKRLKRIVNGFYNFSWFGVVADCSYSFTSNSIPTGTDNLSSINNAISAIPDFSTVIFPKGNILVLGEILVNKSINIDGNGSIVISDVNDITKSIFVFSGSYKSTFRNIQIVGSGYQVKAAIEFKPSDNQQVMVDNVKAYQCRYGLYTEYPEVINRASFSNCDFSSNLIAGVYIKSFSSGYGHSAPFSFFNVLANGNGPLDYMYSSTYKGNPIAKSGDLFGYQFYLKGFSNVTITGGQISNHSDSKNIALAWFESGNGLNIDGCDFEDFKNPVKADGTSIDINALQSPEEGGAILIKSVSGINVVGGSMYQINTQSLLKLLYECNDVFVTNINKSGTMLNTIDVVGANTPTNNLKLHTNIDYKYLSANAIHSLSNLQNISYKIEKKDLGYLHKNPFFEQFIDAGNKKYSFGYYLDSNSPNLKYAGAYNELQINGETVFFANIESTQGSFSPDGVFMVEAEGTSGRLSYSVYDTKGDYSQNGRFYKHIKFSIPDATTKLRYGFVNKSNYTGNIPTHATVNAIQIYLFSDFKKNTNLQITKTDTSYCQSIALESIPSTKRNFEQGIVFNSIKGSFSNLGWVCTSPGTTGTLNITGSGSSGNNYFTASSVANITIGDYLSISGSKYKVKDIVGNSVYTIPSMPSSFTNLGVTYYQPTIYPLDSYVSTNATNAANYTPAQSERYVMLDASSNDIFINTPDATANKNRIITFKRIDNSTRYVSFSGTIDGLSNFNILPRNTITIVSDGTNWRVISETGNKHIRLSEKIIAPTGTNSSVGTLVLTSGLGTITSTAITTNSIIWITTKTLSGTSAHDYTYNISSDGTATVTARQSNGSTETGCNSTIQYWIVN